jgi:hypothetical protein
MLFFSYFLRSKPRFIDSIATVIGRVRGELRSAVISKRFADYEMRFLIIQLKLSLREESAR